MAGAATFARTCAALVLLVSLPAAARNASCFDEIDTAALLMPVVGDMRASALSRRSPASSTSGTCKYSSRVVGSAVLLATGLGDDHVGPLRSLEGSHPKFVASTPVPTFVPAPLRPMAKLLLPVADALGITQLERTFTAENMALLAQPAGLDRLTTRLRLDVFYAFGEITSTSALQVTMFPMPPASVAHGLGITGSMSDAEACEAVFDSLDRLREAEIIEVPCAGRQMLHWAGSLLLNFATVFDAAQLGLSYIDPTGYFSNPARQPVSVSVESYLSEAMPPSRQFVESPFCSVDVSALSAPVCVHVGCKSLGACAQHRPHVAVVVSRRTDVIAPFLIAFAVGMLVIAPLVARSSFVQLLVAASFGVLVVVFGTAYYVLNTVSQTRFGKLGVSGLIALGGPMALWHGMLSTLVLWFSTEFQTNAKLQLFVLASSFVSTLVCYRFLGAKLGGIIALSMRSAAALLLVAAVAHNPEVTFGGAAAVPLLWALCTALGGLLWLCSSALARRNARRPPATPARRGVLDDESEGYQADGDTPVHPRRRGLPVAAPADPPQRDPRFEWNEPEENLPPQAFRRTSPARRFARRSSPNSLAARSSSYTESEVDKLHRYIRENAAMVSERVKNPQHVLRQAGWNGEASDTE